VINTQATINVGIIGNVNNGKSTLVNAISGINTTRYKDELKKNKTIKLGYASAKIFECQGCALDKGASNRYQAYESSCNEEKICQNCGKKLNLLRHISFIDCPGHYTYMKTMLNGTAVMDAVVLLVASNEEFPQPQFIEHFKAIRILKLKNILILQNKIDLVDKIKARNQFNKIRSFISGTDIDGSPIIPISAVHKCNLDIVLEYLARKLPEPKRHLTLPVQMRIVRSFDENRPKTPADKMKGGIVGGSILQGVLRVGQEVEISPGTFKKINGRIISTPLLTKVISLRAGEEKESPCAKPMNIAQPGGLIGVGLQIDPSLTRQDFLVGQVLGQIGSLPEATNELEVSIEPLMDSKKKLKNINELTENELFKLHIGSAREETSASLLSKNSTLVKFKLIGNPVCAREGERVFIQREIDNRWQLIGLGYVPRRALN
jgi:translation initiation factor 2 subunit 3